jgi:acyl dehydratase
MTEQVYFEDVSEGDEIPSLAKNCSTQQLVMWAAASGDFYQIHYDIDFAKSTGLDNLIVHGALKNAFLDSWCTSGYAPAASCERSGVSTGAWTSLIRTSSAAAW